MKKEHYHSVIRVLILSDKTCEEIKSIQNGVYGTRTTVYHWFEDFGRGRTSVLAQKWLLQRKLRAVPAMEAAYAYTG